MKFIVNSQLFSKQLQAMSSVLTNNNTVPIITCILFQMEGKTLSMRATDLETTVVSTLELETASDDGVKEVAIPAKLLLDYVKTLNDAPITISVDNNFGVDLACGDGKFGLAGQNGATFPTLPPVEDTSSTTIMASALVSSINKTLFAASTDEMRQQMSGIFFDFTTEKMTVVATDAHKLVRYRRTDVKASEDVSFIVPKKPLNVVKNIIAGNKEDVEVSMEYNTTNVSFSFANFRVVCRLVDGRYPNYELAIPKDNPNHLVVDRAELMTALRRVSLFSNKATQQVRFTLVDQELTISAEDIEFSNNGRDKVACHYEGNAMEIGFSAKFLLEMLNNLDTERIRIEMSHPNMAGIIYPQIDEESETPNPEDLLMLVMPMMLAN